MYRRTQMIVKDINIFKTKNLRSGFYSDAQRRNQAACKAKRVERAKRANSACSKYSNLEDPTIGSSESDLTENEDLSIVR